MNFLLHPFWFQTEFLKLYSLHVYLPLHHSDKPKIQKKIIFPLFGTLDNLTHISKLVISTLSEISYVLKLRKLLYQWWTIISSLFHHSYTVRNDVHLKNTLGLNGTICETLVSILYFSS